MRRPADDAPLVREDSVCVLGSAKPTRDLAALRLLAEARPAARLSLHGRGWENLSGWDVEDRHLSEAEFDRCLAVAGCVVIPYVRFYSSGVAVRALEQLAPVVGPRHPQLEQLLGIDWPGLVEDRADWPAAVRRACAITAEDIAGRRDAYFARCRDEWAAFAATAGNRVAA
jgi:hypothetical protein